MEMNNNPSLEQIAKYLEEMKFKTRVFGGVSQENVLEHFEEVNKMYQEIFESLQNLNEAQQKQIEQFKTDAAANEAREKEIEAKIKEMEQQVKEKEQQIKALREKLHYLKKTDSISGKKEELYQIYDEYKGKLVSAIKSFRK